MVHLIGSLALFVAFWTASYLAPTVSLALALTLPIAGLIWDETRAKLVRFRDVAAAA